MLVFTFTDAWLMLS